PRRAGAAQQPLPGPTASFTIPLPRTDCAGTARQGGLADEDPVASAVAVAVAAAGAATVLPPPGVGRPPAGAARPVAAAALAALRRRGGLRRGGPALPDAFPQTGQADARRGRAGGRLRRRPDRAGA